jgi:hypothetical protein
MSFKISIKRIICFSLITLSTGILLSCAESKEMVIKKKMDEYKTAVQNKTRNNQNIFDQALKEMTTRYEDILDLRDDKKSELLVRAYNNPEENPDISNSTIKSENEFQNIKDKEIYKTYRSKQYAMIGLYLYGNKIPKYDFEKKKFIIPYNRINIMAPESIALYSGKRPPVVDIILKTNKDVILKMEPEEAEKFKSGITVTGGGGYYAPPAEQKDTAIIYFVFKINGQIREGEKQHISTDIIDYICVWFVDGATKPLGCNNKIECATEVKVFKK